MSNEPVAKYEPIELHVLHSHIAGVLFDLMGWLTSRKERLTLSSADHAGPAVEAITEFAKMRGLHLEDAQVEHWQAILTNPVDDTALLRQVLDDLCASRLCHLNSMSSRQEVERLIDKAITALRERLGEKT
jgi:hypothetical protein